MALTFHFADYKFIRYQGMDCLTGSEIHQIYTFEPPNYKCDKWCMDHSNCGGYTVAGNTCFFKNVSCKNNLFPHESINTYIPQGNIVNILYTDCINIISYQSGFTKKFLKSNKNDLVILIYI